MFALELETYRRCFPAQLALSALQWYIRRKCAHLQRDLVATADLPPHSALFSQRLWDVTHRWWTEREDNNIDSVDVHSLVAAVFDHIKLHSARYPDLVPHQFPDPQQPARPLADLLTAIAALLARRQHHNAPFLHPAWTIQHPGVSQPRAWHLHASSFDLSLQTAPGVSSSLGSLNARSFHWFPPSCLLGVLKILLTCTFQSRHSLWTRGPATREAQRGFSRARSGFVSNWPECA